jgi:hypothetical protein
MRRKSKRNWKNSEPRSNWLEGKTCDKIDECVGASVIDMVFEGERERERERKRERGRGGERARERKREREQRFRLSEEMRK